MRRSRFAIVTLLLAAIAPSSLTAQEAAQDTAGGLTAEQFEATLGYTSGHVMLKDGLASLEVPATFHFVPAEGAARLLEQGWGNPKGSGDGVLGMLVPASSSPLSDEGWGVVITYDEDGYVDDKDAASIDYSKLLKEMQEGDEEENKERVKQGYKPVHLIGWAETPTYDQATHKLYWAKELAFGEGDHHTLNYNVRILGRRGVLVLNAVAGMEQMQQIKAAMPEVIHFVEFKDGHRYTDFVSGDDKVAAYGIAGLVAGAVATKAGFFKLLLAALIAGKKAVIIGIAGLAAVLKRKFGKKDDAAAPSA